jgi:hypothetical protein
VVRWAGHGRGENAHKILVRKPEGKISLGTFVRGWENNI